MPYLKVGEENSGDINLYYKDWGCGQMWFDCWMKHAC